MPSRQAGSLFFWALFPGTFFSFLLFFEPVNSPRYHRQNQTIKSIKLRGIFRRLKFMPGGSGEPTFPGVSFPQKIRRGKEPSLRFKTQGGGGRAVTAFRSWVQPFSQTRAGQRPRGLGQSPKKEEEVAANRFSISLTVSFFHLEIRTGDKLKLSPFLSLWLIGHAFEHAQKSVDKEEEYLSIETPNPFLPFQ